MATSVKTTTFTRTSKTGEVRRVLDLVRDRNLQVVDVKFCDLPGTWQHFSIPASALDEEVFRDGLGFDGSSIRGIPGDQRERHAPVARSRQRVRGSGAGGADALAHLRYLRPDHAGTVLPGPALHRASRRRSTSRRPASRPRPSGDRRRSSSSSTRCGSTRTRTRATTTSTPRKGCGTRAATALRTWGTGPGTRRATSRCRRPTGCRTCGRRSCSR